MALVKCRECNESVSTEADACPHCGVPQQRPTPPPLPVQPSSVQPKEVIIYSDKVVVVTNLRVIIGGTTYALRNITSVRMAFTSPRIGIPVLLLLLGAFLLMLTVFPIPFHDKNYDPVAGFILSGFAIGGSILWLCSIRLKYHVDLSSASGEIHALTSKNKAYIERIVLSINEAIVRH
jgi:hypothetical protein